jgi:hypothetical protein
MILFSEFVAWQNFAATRLAEAEVEEEGADRDVRRIDAENLVLADPAVGTVKKTMAAVRLEDRVQRANDTQLQAYAKRKMTRVVFDNCERCANLISRELSRRTAINPTERRNSRWNP